MKSMRWLALLGCAAFAAPSAAATFSNSWSFVDDITGQTVGGIISGLQNGTNLSAAGLTITITQSPYAELLGDYTFDAGTSFQPQHDHYSATGGVVTLIDLFYQDATFNKQLFLGTDPFDTYYPENYNGAQYTYSFSAPTFSAATAAPTPEPATWALMVGGFGLAGAAMRRKRVVVRFA